MSVSQSAANGNRAARLTRLALIPLFFILGPRLAGATIFVNSEMAPLAFQADTIALGTVRVLSSRWEAGRIVSDAQVELSQVIKGAAPRTITVVAAGGKVGDVAMRVIGGAQFHVGDRSILFLTAQGGIHRVVGLAAGKLDVFTRRGQQMVTWPAAGPTGAVPLDTALDQLRTVAQSPRR